MSDTPDNRPWERDVWLRRDCRPHRARLLHDLAIASLVLGGLSVITLFPSLLGLPLAVTVGMLAHHDLALMAVGRMDPRGRQRTKNALGHAYGGVALNLLGLVPLVVLYGAPFLDRF
jgi:hypothetical protein